MDHQCHESESASSSTTISRRSSEPLPEPSEPRCHYERRLSWASGTSSSARSLLSVESSCTEASEFPDFGITATVAPRELQEMLDIRTDSSANSDTSSDGGNDQVRVPAAASAAEPSGNQPRRLLRRSSFCKGKTKSMTKSRRRRVTFNDGVISELAALSVDNHPGAGQRDEVVELKIELCNQKRLIAVLQARIQFLEQWSRGSIPGDVNDDGETSHARDEHRQIDELNLELANERGRNAALSSRVTDVEARNRTLEEENEDLRRTVAEIRDKTSSFRCNVARSLTQSGKSTGTEETVLGISSSDSDSSSMCSCIITQSAGEMSCFEEKGAREEAENSR